MPKKTAAQLQREINKALIQSPEPSGSGATFRRAGTKVSIEPSPSGRRKGLIHKTRKYGVLMEDARIGPGGGWDVYDVQLPDGSETSAYGFDLRLAPSAIFREAVGKRSKSHARKAKSMDDYEAEGYKAHSWYLADCPYTQPKIRDAWQRGAWKWQQEQRSQRPAKAGRG